jgi:hypothetical protein
MTLNKIHVSTQEIIDNGFVLTASRYIKKETHTKKGEVMASIIYTKDGKLHDIYEMTLPQAISEFGSRTLALTEICELQGELIAGLMDKVIKLEDRLDALERS